MKMRVLLALVVFLAIFGLIAFSGRVVAQNWFSGATGLGGDIIALITVEGVITGESSDAVPFYGSTAASSVRICQLLYDAADDSQVKAVVLRVNSPGGSAAASDEIYHAVEACKAKKPVVVSMGDLAASGGYYVCAPASYIFANGATLTGSIGVIFSMLNWEELAAKVGIEDITLHAGEYKDIGSPWREMTGAERSMLADLLDDVHGQFISAVAAGRQNLTEEQVVEAANGMIYTGAGALALGLVDEIGGLHAAEEKARQLANVGSGVPVEAYGAGSFWEEFFSIKAPGSLESMLAGQAGAGGLSALARGLYLNSTLRDLVVR
ncbi:signal peptide peptidase SppA [bacterium]|nr:signal peptide peptidase SppA [bacterium]